jgi:tetratricopeptide (TPR) repeat protein
MTMKLVLALALAIFIAASPVVAQPAPRPEAPAAVAKRRFTQGEAYFKAGAFDLAAAEYEAAYAAVAEPGLLFNIGLAWENHGDRAAAIAYYDRYLAAVSTGGRSAEARARRDVLVRAVDEARAAEAARAEAARAEAARAEAARAEAARAEAARAEAARAEAARAEAARRDRPSWIPPIAAYGVGAVALGVGIVYGLEARSIGDELENELEDGEPPVDTGDPRFDDGRSAAVTADVAFGIAGAAAVVGAVLTYRVLAARRRGPDAVTLTPRLGGDDVGATLEVRW